MKPNNLHLVIIAGGSGTRFWPKSTSKRPKQLIAFQSAENRTARSLLQQTLDRFEKLVPPAQRTILTTEALREAVANEQLEARILAEPVGRNTAPCIYWAAKEVLKADPNGIMLIMPADHTIAHCQSFISTVEKAAQWASQNNDLITLGVTPTRPETGYGYLRTSHYQNPPSSFGEIQKVEAFVEKPNLEKATGFLQSGNYLWNGGMFIWKASVILDAFDAFMPEMKQAWEKSGGQVTDAYPHMPATSIDYGIMEKAKNVVTFPLNCGWDDLGSWISLEGMAQEWGIQRGKNVSTSPSLISVDSSGNIVDVPQRLVALLGIQNLIVVEHGQSLLIADKERAQDIRTIVEEVKKTRPELA